MMQHQNRFMQPEHADVDEVISRLSHDLRAPVRAIIEVSGWVEEDLEGLASDLPIEVHNNLKLLQSRGNRLQALIADLSAYVGAGRGGQIFDGNWGPMMGEIADDVPALSGFNLSLDFAFAPRVPKADLQTLLTVLLSNATKHHHRDQGELSVSVRPALDGWVIEVDDDGPGIPPELREHATGFLTTLQPRDVVEGSGLGLAIARRIVDNLGGEMVLDTPQSGQGCRVAIKFPE